MPPERSIEQHSRTVEHRSDSDGGLLIPTLAFTIGTMVGWVAYLFAALVVLNYLVRLDAAVTVIPDLSPTANLWLAGGVLLVIAFALFARPGTVLAGWSLMGFLVAVAATYFVGWTDTIVIVEGLTVAFVVFATFVKIIEMLPDWAVFALALDRRRR